MAALLGFRRAIPSQTRPAIAIITAIIVRALVKPKGFPPANWRPPVKFPVKFPLKFPFGRNICRTNKARTASK